MPRAPSYHHSSIGRPSITSSKVAQESYESATRKALNQTDVINVIIDVVLQDPCADSRNSTLYAASRLAQKWREPATKALYIHLEPTTPFGVNRLLTTLQNNPHFASRARSFVMPTFPNLHFQGTNLQRTPKLKNTLSRMISGSSSGGSSSTKSEDYGSFSSEDYYLLLQTFNLIGLLLPPESLHHISLPCIVNGEPRISGSRFFFSGHRLDATLRSLTCHSALLTKTKTQTLGLRLPVLQHLTLVGQCHNEIDMRIRGGWVELPSLARLSLARNTFSIEFLRDVLANFSVEFVPALELIGASFRSDSSKTSNVPPARALKSFPLTTLLTCLTVDLQAFPDSFDKKTDFSCLLSLALKGQRWKHLKSVIKDLPRALKLDHLRVELTEIMDVNVVRAELKTLLEAQQAKFPLLKTFWMGVGGEEGCVVKLALTKKRSR